MKKQRIEIINRYFLPVTAGIEVCLAETTKRLVKQNWAITLHVSRNSLTEKNVFPKNGSYHSVAIRRYTDTPFGFFPKVNWKEADIISLQNFTLFPHVFLLTYALTLKLTGRKNFKLLLTPHGGYTPEWETFSRVSKLIKKFLHNIVGKFLINTVVDGIHAVSEWEKDELIKQGIAPSLITVIHNGIEDIAFSHTTTDIAPKIKTKVKQWGTYIVQIGRIHPIKNQQATINALPFLPKNINFVIVGPIEDNHYKKRLELHVKKLGVEERVIFAGTISGADKYFVMKHALAMVHMALWEAYCNVIVEAFSQGTFVITSSIPALKSLIFNKDGQHGFIVDAEKPKELASKIHSVLKQTDDIKKIKNTNIAFAQNNSWDTIADIINLYYKNTVSIRLSSEKNILQRFSEIK